VKRGLGEVLDIRVPLTVVLAQKTMTLGQVLVLAPGTVVEFDKGVAAPLELLLNERRIALGRAVRVGENFGLQVTEIADPGTLVMDLARPHP